MIQLMINKIKLLLQSIYNWAIRKLWRMSMIDERQTLFDYARGLISA